MYKISENGEQFRSLFLKAQSDVLKLGSGDQQGSLLVGCRVSPAELRIKYSKDVSIGCNL